MKTTHLTPGQIAMCAEAMNRSEYDKLPKEIRQHLAFCNDCSYEVNVVVETVIESAIENEQNKKSRRNISLFISLAAALIVLFSLGFLIKKQNKPIQPDHSELPGLEQDDKVMHQALIKKAEIKNKQEKSNLTEIVEPLNVNPNQQKKETEKNVQKVLLAYVPNEQLEKWAQRYAEYNMRGESVVIKTPFLLETNETFFLEWENQKNEKLTIEIFNNKGEKIDEAEVNKFRYSPKSELSPGLYYWKLINEDFDLLFCGKIKIK